MISAAKRKSTFPAGFAALRLVLLLVVALCLPETRVWGFATTPQPASGVFESANPLSIRENTIGIGYDASDSLHAARTTQIVSVGEVGVLRQGSFVNRVYDSRFGQPGAQVSGPLGRSFTPGSGVPTTAGEAIQQRGLNLFYPNNAERAVIYRATGDIPTINRTSIGGSAPETLIDPRYFDQLERVRDFSLPR